MSLSDYASFDIDLGPAEGGAYALSVLDSPAGVVRTRFVTPFTDADLHAWHALVTASMPAARGLTGTLPAAPASWSGGQTPSSSRRMTEAEQRAVEWGLRLSTALFDAQVHALYRESRRRAAAAKQGLRIKLRVRAPELAVLPWELLLDPDAPISDPCFLALSRQTPVVRFLEVGQAAEPLAVRGALRILAMGASPADLTPIDIESERRHLAAAFPRWNHLVRVEWVAGQDWRSLQERLQAGGPYHVFHFIGHAFFDGVSNTGYIALADAAGQPELRTANELADLLADHPTLKLIVLNACESAEGSPRDLTSSIAATLVTRGFPAVAAMQTSVSDRAAIEFARSFYRAISNRLPVDAACTEARKAMHLAAGHTLEWVIPTLYMRAADGRLFQREGVPIHWAKVFSLLLFTLMVLGAAAGWWWWRSTRPIPTGAFNVAVADFVENGATATALQAGAVFGQSLSDALENEYTLSGATDVAIVHQHVGRIAEANAAAELVKSGFQMVIYGSVDGVGDQLNVRTKFLVSDAFRNDMGEITGAHDFAFPLTIHPSEIFTLTPTLAQRASLLVDLIQGVDYAAQDRLTEAAAALARAAAESEPLGVFAGREVIYLFASDVARRRARLDEAEQLALLALDLNPNYGRGYIALANSLFLRGDPYLAEAQTLYEQALLLPEQPHAAFIAEKAHLGLGLVYFRRYQLAYDDASPYADDYAAEAAAHYQAVIGSIPLQPPPAQSRLDLLAQAYLGLGGLERQRGIATAPDRFCRALEISQNTARRHYAQDILAGLGVACPGRSSTP
ncbi:MAG TPA: CHAT domain-containing protein [Chloroflexi bacterium]|nr:CHAT domain-containing protein [Chloroflexota bacterium]